MENLAFPLWQAILILVTVVFAIIIGASYLLSLASAKDDTIRKMQSDHNKLMRSFNELDEQAKLIVRTDIELNKAHEELDKRLDALNALQRTSRQISQALNENEIYQKLRPSLFEELGFTRAMVASMDDNNIMRPRVTVGFDATAGQTILTPLANDEHFNAALKESHTFSSINVSRKTKEKIVELFETEHFILSPILTQNGCIGFVFVGNRYATTSVTQADEEFIAILAGQIGQSIENAHLFEKVFRSSQELEIKVKERTKQLATVLEQVEDVSQRKTDFISAVSHELRTPLTSIKGYAALLMTGKIGDIPPAVKERLGKINTHSDNLVELINNLLDIARIESGRVEMNFGLHKVPAVVENIADLLAPQINAKEIKLNINIPAGIDEFYVDFSQAERIFINLLSNAIKFTPKQGTITVSASPTLERGYITFSVADTGIGIAAEDIKKLFNEFYRVENEINQNVKGTGLGLSLVKNIVEAHRGKIWVNSQPGMGTTFMFTLPASADAYEASKLYA